MSLCLLVYFFTMKDKVYTYVMQCPFLTFLFLRSLESLRWPIDIVLDILTITKAFPPILHSQHHVYNRLQLLVKSPGRHLNNYHRCRHSRRICISKNSWRRESKSGYPANQHKNYSSVRIHNDQHCLLKCTKKACFHQ